MKIPFNKPYLSGKELYYISKTVHNGHTAGNKEFTQKCHKFFQDQYGFGKCLLTTSCTDALEMAALLTDIEPGDEVIIPSFTFVSTSNAFVLRGAKIVFADSLQTNPNIDHTSLEELISPKTKAIVVVHYAGIACHMDEIVALCKKHNLYLIEDAAQAIDSYYKGKPLGSIGELGAFSFHETKNIISGEGGMLTINDSKFNNRSEIIWEKGTNRSAFFRGEVDKYGWVDVGSSFLPSELIAAFLYAQLENLEDIQQRRIEIWNRYNNAFQSIQESGGLQLPYIPEFATNNAHMYYIVCNDLEDRNALIQKLKSNNIHAVFHYLSLHKSNFYNDKHDGRNLPESDRYTECLLRLPMFYELSDDNQARVIDTILEHYQ